jgi:hypothetical protein
VVELVQTDDGVEIVEIVEVIEGDQPQG